MKKITIHDTVPLISGSARAVLNAEGLTLVRATDRRELTSVEVDALVRQIGRNAAQVILAHQEMTDLAEEET